MFLSLISRYPSAFHLLGIRSVERILLDSAQIILIYSRFAMFFPLRTPVCIKPGSPLEVHFWRCCGSSKVWYEWCVTSPDLSAIHNSSGRSY
ncbi:hypothetical protein Peur_009550 [Populus x canadensis]